MPSLEVQAQFAVAERFVTASCALVVSFLVMHSPCVNFNCKVRLEYLFTQFALHEFKNVFVRELYVSLKHIKCFKSQVAILAGKFSLAIMHLDVTLQSLIAGENLRALLTIDCPLKLFLHVNPQMFIGEVQFSTVGTHNTETKVFVHVSFQRV